VKPNIKLWFLVFLHSYQDVNSIQFNQQLENQNGMTTVNIDGYCRPLLVHYRTLKATIFILFNNYVQLKKINGLSL